MEKYTVDISKVLDDFEESEALEAEQLKLSDHHFFLPGKQYNCDDKNLIDSKVPNSCDWDQHTKNFPIQKLQGASENSLTEIKPNTESLCQEQSAAKNYEVSHTELKLSTDGQFPERSVGDGASSERTLSSLKHFPEHLNSSISSEFSKPLCDDKESSQCNQSAVPDFCSSFETTTEALGCATCDDSNDSTSVAKNVNNDCSVVTRLSDISEKTSQNGNETEYEQLLSLHQNAESVVITSAIYDATLELNAVGFPVDIKDDISLAEMNEYLDSEINNCEKSDACAGSDINGNSSSKGLCDSVNVPITSSPSVDTTLLHTDEADGVQDSDAHVIHVDNNMSSDLPGLNNVLENGCQNENEPVRSLTIDSNGAEELTVCCDVNQEVTLPSQVSNIEDICVDNNCNIPQNSDHDITNSQTQLLNAEMNDLEISDHPVPTDVLENGVTQNAPSMKLVFYPNEGTFRSVPSDEVLHGAQSSNSSAFKNNLVNFNDGRGEETLPIPETIPRLQRPTTLNLPCQGIANSVPQHDEVETSSAANSMQELTLAKTDSEAVDADHPEVILSKIGTIKPFWVPDANASNCMHCGLKFTIIKRRHHCRACGKVLCSRCCNQKARLPYLLNKEDRVCQQCIEILIYNEGGQENEEDLENGESPISSSCGSSPSFSPTPANSNSLSKVAWRPHPNNPDDYCSTISPFQQVQELANLPPPTVMVPVGVLKRGNKPRGITKQVIFSDGIRPGGDLTDLTEAPDVLPYRGQTRALINVGQNGSSELDKMDLDSLFPKFQDENAPPIEFALNKNMHVSVKVIKLDCCFGKECWCFTSHGLCTVGQDEVILLLERLEDEITLPRDAFKMFHKLFDDATEGVTVSDLGHLIFPDGIFGSWEHRGFLFVRPTFQCLSKIVVPDTPYLFAILIQKWEVPWAKIFPLRLMLRIGAECRYYPCSLVSIRFRKPLYFEIGQTIMSVLADLRNFQFTLPFVPGLVVHMEDKTTYVNIPRNRYEELIKVLNSNNVEHVLSLGSNFSTDADSHLVCLQKDEGDYQTQAINIEHASTQVTGASFIVFSGALKTSTGLSAKFSIVEDGLLIQITQETMVALHSALRDMHDLTIKCGKVDAPEPEALVMVQWVNEDKKFNIGVTSPIDNSSLESVFSIRIHTSTDYAGENHVIRWTEVFFLQNKRRNRSRRCDNNDPYRISETIAQAFCMSLVPYLDLLVEAEMTKLGLRVTLDAEKDMVQYDVGSLGQNLPSMYMNTLDSSLIPVLSRITMSHQDDPIALELIFYILMK